ncbi:MAG: DUF882 domain-containing protein [Pseudomonadota bacterium]
MVKALLFPLLLALTEDTRSLAFVHTHTGERIDVTYRIAGELVPEAIDDLNRFLRDHRNGEVMEMDPRLFDLLWTMRERAGSDEPFHLVSGYRSPQTNEMLRGQGRKVAKKSQHVEGKAIDVRLPGVPTERLRDIARELGVGGVGFYQRSDFVHVDTGRVRYW